MSLESVGKLVAAHSSSPEAEEMKIQQADAERALVQRMMKWMMWGIFILGIGMVMLVLNKSFAVGKWLQLLGFFFLLTGTGMTSYGVLAAIRDGATLKAKTARKSIPLEEPTKSFPSRGIKVSLPSVTERTTQLIAPADASEAHERGPKPDSLP
jgi:hypothetical protein